MSLSDDLLVATALAPSPAKTNLQPGRTRLRCATHRGKSIGERT